MRRRGRARRRGRRTGPRSSAGGSAPSRPASPGAVKAARGRVAVLPCSQLLGELPCPPRRYDAQLSPQPLRQPRVRRERGGAVSGLGEQPHQPARGLLRQRVRADVLAGPAECDVAARGLRQPRQQRGDVLAVLVAERDRPVAVQPRGAPRPCTARAPPRPAASARPARRPTPRASATVSRSATTTSPSSRRSSCSAVRSDARALDSSTSGQKRDASSSRGCAPGCNASHASSSRAGRPAGVRTVAVGLDAELPEEPHAQHARSLPPHS